MTENTTEPSATIGGVLARRYGLVPDCLVQIPIGQGTTNYRATCAGREVFVKNYPPGIDLIREADATELSALAGLHGIPVAGLLHNRDGEPVDTSTSHAISVWEWVSGAVVTADLTAAQARAAGTALGRIHAAFAALPASAGSSPQAQRWLGVNVRDLAATIDRLIGMSEARIAAGIAEPFDVQAARTLAERRDSIKEIPQLMGGLPTLTTQVLHGDYSPVNVLFDADRLSAVIDFRPPDPFFIAYEVGRIAFYPNTVATTADWLATARTLIEAYVQANPTVADHDIRASAQVALLQLLKSLYGVKQHYLKPGIIQDALDEFWLQRHRAVRVLLDHQGDTDALLADLLGRR
ncbi:aminoglycoside phosphotransferase [Micromonospora craterilacus]|uniref:Aminoglycoside phosphotransferase n=1 Tax=Micromonospora craterilacus TaxID=1655439 RepID=A0A2W2G1J0_9ACTN|nr:phosphotransferase [Micromonospora craterilacus]PZG20744.1 aminoglycoside phosphotransferase [Micromonospora craterilacus]